MFREATFEFGYPSTIVPGGRAVRATLTSVFNTGKPYFGALLCTLRWEPGDGDKRPADASEE
jgi:hypothetical protein